MQPSARSCRRFTILFSAALAVAVAMFAMGGVAAAASKTAAASGSTTAKATATLSILEPNVSVKRAGGTAFKPAKNGQRLRVGDKVQTDADGFAQINYTDDSFTRLDVSTTFTIVSLTDDAGNRKIKGSVDTGRTWNRTSALTESETFEQEGAGATAAVVGSAFIVSCTAPNNCVFTSVVDGLRITTVDGEVQFLDPLEACDSDELSDADADLCTVPEAVALEVLIADGWIAANLFVDASEGYPGPVQVLGIVVVEDGQVTSFTPSPTPPPSDPPANDPPPDDPPPSGPQPACGTAPTDPPTHYDGSPGTGAPPSTLGTCAMSPFADDTRPNGQTVSDVAAPGGGLITFSAPLTHVSIGNGWATWSHGHTGPAADVYYLDSGGTMTMTLPANTYAFSFYAEPNNFGDFDMTATESGGATSGPVSVTGNAGATYFGFYTTSDEAPLTSVTVTIDGSGGSFAVGEFMINQQTGTLSQDAPPADIEDPPPGG